MSSRRKGPLRVGVIGGGLIAQLAHLPLVSGASGLELAALAEPDGRVRAEVARRYELPAVFEDHREMLDAEAPDAVIVCSPNETHAAIAIDAVEAGCAVLVEKPLCLDPEDGRQLLAAARARRAVVQVAYMKRFDPSVMELMRTLPRSDLRRIESITVDNAIGRRFRPASEAPGHTPGQAYSLAFCGALIHDVNLVLDVLERLGLGATVVGADSSLDADFAACECRLSNGGVWTSSWRLDPTASRFSETLRFAFADGVRTLSLPMPYGDVARVYGPQLKHFVARMQTGDSSLKSIEDGVRDVALLEDAYRRSEVVSA